MSVIEAVVLRLKKHPGTQRVRLVGSRATSSATELSDWDLQIETEDFDSVAKALPELMAELDPLAQLWDPLSEHANYILILDGAIKVDLLFLDEPFETKPPWEVTPQTLPLIDNHFWDWILWLAAKDSAGRNALVGQELKKMHWYLLAPMGVPEAPDSVQDAIKVYLTARDRLEEQLDCTVDKKLGEAVRPRLEPYGYWIP